MYSNYICLKICTWHITKTKSQYFHTQGAKEFKCVSVLQKFFYEIIPLKSFPIKHVDFVLFWWSKSTVKWWNQKPSVSVRKQEERCFFFPSQKENKGFLKHALIYFSNFKYLKSSGSATGVVVFLTVNKSKILCVNIGMKPLRRLQHATHQRVHRKKELVIEDNCDHWPLSSRGHWSM